LKYGLEALLEESAASCQSRERDTFDNLIGTRTGLVLFGAGGLGRKVLSTLRDAGIEPLAFADNKIAGQVVQGIRVLTPAEAAAAYRDSATFVVTIWAAWADAMEEQIASLRTLGCKSVISFIPLLWKYPHLLPHTQIDAPSRLLEQKDEIRRCYELWADEDSRREFVAQVRWRLLGDFAALNPPVPNQYWQRDLFSLGDDAIFADAGAFDGDTIEQFVSFTGGRFRAIYAFEPDSRNLSSLRKRLKAMPHEMQSRIHVFDRAVAEAQYEVSFHGGDGASSAPGSGAESVSCVALDQVLPERPHCIKYDIEGFELLGLTGTRKIIAENRPVLVVCAYHLQNHIWQIPLRIHSFNRNYRFYLRPHGQIWETVCYAVPT
jgi:FkbM family methyltransferase